MIRVAICGCYGKMGKTVVGAVGKAEDMEAVCGISVVDDPGTCFPFPVYKDLAEALDAHEIDVFVDFTQPDAIEATLRTVLPRGIDCVVGTTGLKPETLRELADLAPKGTCLFYAPNFTTGAVLMMQFAKAAAPYFPQAEIIEMHHAGKKDAPSGTALNTASMIAEAQGSHTQAGNDPVARGLDSGGVHIHSVRSDGFVASQEVILGSYGQTLTIRHDSWDRESYMPGVLLGIRNVAEHEGLIVGLEHFMQ